MAMLEVKDLEVYYGMIQAIKGISFEVNQGEVVALIGAMIVSAGLRCYFIEKKMPRASAGSVQEGTDDTGT